MQEGYRCLTINFDVNNNFPYCLAFCLSQLLIFTEIIVKLSLSSPFLETRYYYYFTLFNSVNTLEKSVFHVQIPLMTDT